MHPGVNKLINEKYDEREEVHSGSRRQLNVQIFDLHFNAQQQLTAVVGRVVFVARSLLVFTWTLARTTSMGLVMVEAVAAAIGPAKACRIRWGHSLGANRDSCSVTWREINNEYSST